MTRSRLVPALLLALSAGLMALSGCALLTGLQNAFRKPTLNFLNASLGDVSLGGATLNLHYRLDNPNPIGLNLAQVAYALEVEGHQVVAGSPPAGLKIPASGHSDLVFPAGIKFADLGPVLETFLHKDNATYRAHGSIGVKTPIGVLALPFQKDGTFEVPKVPQVQFATPRITQINFSSATVEFPLTVTNRSSFALPINRVGGALQLAGSSVGTVDSGNLGALAGRASRELTLPLTIHFAQAAGAAAALTRGSGTVGFAGSVQSGPVSIPLNFSQNLNFQR